MVRMFGNKENKKQRLAQIPTIIQTHQPVRRSLIARMLGVRRSTITKDINMLAKKGVRLAEDDKGRLSMPE